MPKINKVPKKPATIAMTDEAWAILHQRAIDSRLSKSDYLENLVRRGEAVLYDATREFLTEHYLKSRSELVEMRKRLEALEQENENVRQFLRTIGVSPNLIP